MKEYLELYLAFFKIGLFTFGGGYAMLPMLEKEVINKRKWATSEEVMEYFAIGQITPGIIAVNTATFIGYFKKGIFGGICATLGVISPSVIIIILIAGFLNDFRESEVVMHALNGIKIAVCVLMSMAIFKLFKSNINDILSRVIFIAALVASFFANIPTAILILIFAFVGIFSIKLKTSNEVKK